MAAPKDIDEYLSTVTEESRVALEKLRKTIASARIAENEARKAR